MKKLNKDNKGFSLVELLVVIAIMVVLVGVIAPSLLSNIEKAREAKDIQALDTLAGNIQAAMTNEKVYDAIIALNGTAVDLKQAYDATAFGGSTDADTKLQASLTDSLATASIYGGDSGAINLFGSKTAKTAVDAGGKIKFSVNSTTGKLSVYLTTTSSDSTAKEGKSVTFSVER